MVLLLLVSELWLLISFDYLNYFYKFKEESKQ